MKKTNKTFEKSKQVETFLSFELNKELFGVNVKNLTNILEMQKITDVPQSPNYFSGVINLRGEALPVIDLRIILGIPKLDITNNTCILVLEVSLDKEEIMVGAIVDKVNAVIEVDVKNIDPAPGIGSNYHSDFISGMWKTNDQFIMLLDIEKTLTSKKISIPDSVT